MFNWLMDRFRMWKWVIVMGLVVLFGPGLTFTAFAQNGRGGEAALRTGCPLLCCSDIQGPDIGPGGAIVILVLFGIGIAILVAIDAAEQKAKAKAEQKAQEERDAEEKKRQEKLAADALKYPQLKGVKVFFQQDGTTLQGVVTDQDEDRITISYLSDQGTLATAHRKCPDVKPVY